MLRDGLAALAMLCLCAAHVGAATFVVENTADSGHGSLREAIVRANSQPNTGEPDTIVFSIPGSGVHTITVGSALPDITESVRLDGWTQPGFADAPLVELTSGAGSQIDGLRILGGGTTVRGLVISGFRNAIYLGNNGGNTVQGCYLGTDATGTSAAPNDRGIFSEATSDNLIGGTTIGARNLISGNRFDGVLFFETGSWFIQSSRNTFQGNYVGTDVTGTYLLPNGTGSQGGGAGLSIMSNEAMIGGLAPGGGNLVSGNNGHGIVITGRASVITGNTVGTDLSGSSALPNRGHGILFASLGGTIGGPALAARNLISGNLSAGISINSSQGTVQGNFVGTDRTGKFALPNGGGGVVMAGNENLIGGMSRQVGNLISGNGAAGIVITPMFSTRTSVPSFNNVIQGNLIGTNANGTAALPNSGAGISLRGAVSTLIGGSTLAARNVISGNFGDGIEFADPLPYSTRIQGNFIGTSEDGRAALGNQGSGILLRRATAAYPHPGQVGTLDTVGATEGPDRDAGNLIRFNLRNGITVRPAEAVPHRISSNSISDNGELGVDLGEDGVTPNDLDPSPSPSPAVPPQYCQNFPVITAAFGFEENLTIYGTFSSVPSTDFTLEFFANKSADTSGFGEGQILLGQAKVRTDDTGEVAFNVAFPLPPDTSVVTATAITPSGNTSEFSRAVEIARSRPSTPPTAPTAVVFPTRAEQLLNLSTRAQVMSGDRVLIAGFIISGSEPKPVIVRGIGPSLGGSGVATALNDPLLELYDSAGALITTNNNWKDTQQAEIERTGIAPTHDSESAIARTLSPGSYTAVLRGRNDDTRGIGLVEVYDLGSSTDGDLVNLSTRGFVGTGDDVMIGGFIVAGGGGGATTVVLRALGPSLAASGVEHPLADPRLEVRNANGALVTQNDDWGVDADGSGDRQARRIRATALAPSDDREAAVVDEFPPGNYTVIVPGKNDVRGVALIEAYNVR